MTEVVHCLFEDQMRMAVRLAKDFMEKRPAGFSVPLIVDVKSGADWGQCQ